MEYNYISFDELLDLIKRGLINIREKDVEGYILDKNNIIKMYILICHDASFNSKVYGFCIGVVYKANTMTRHSQWRFGENKYRELYIDLIDTELDSECKGSVLLKNVESKLAAHKDNVQRKNIYLISLYDAFSFYENCGYTEIITPDNDEFDDDYPSSFTDGACIGTWMAKPLDDKLDNENPPNYITEYLFGDAGHRNSFKMLQKYLTFEVDLSLFWFLWSANFEEFKIFTRRKYKDFTKEEFIEKFYKKYSEFLYDMRQYNMLTREDEGKNLNPIASKCVSKYFKNLSDEDIRLVLNNYFYECESSLYIDRFV